MVGKVVSHYRIFKGLGEGGVSGMDDAHDTRLDPAVAFTFALHGVTANEREHARFLHQAQAAFVLRQPSIRTIHLYAQEDPTRDLAYNLPITDGETLTRHIPWTLACGIWLNL